jgi:hypothetical protein
MPDHENLLVPWDACSRRYVVNVGPLDFAGNGGTLPHTRLPASLKPDAKDSLSRWVSTDSSDARKR